MIVPGGEGQRPTIFKGAKKAIKGDKECLLVYDERTKELRLERVSANIFVKKTRQVLQQNLKNQSFRFFVCFLVLSVFSFAFFKLIYISKNSEKKFFFNCFQRYRIRI